MRALILVVLLGGAIAGLSFVNWPQPQHRDAVFKKMKNWDAVPQEDWRNTQAPTILDLLQPMLGGFPSRMEGRPSFAINVRRLERDTVMLAHLQMRGFLDDSVNGEEFTALIDSSQGSWKLIALWRRHECARGYRAGRWTTEPCA